MRLAVRERAIEALGRDISMVQIRYVKTGKTKWVPQGNYQRNPERDTYVINERKGRR
jgi:hypothetical protein